MAKIFDVSDWLNNHPNRNNFDLTHKVHASYKMGVLYPFLCKPVVPTDSFRIDTAISARFMPMPFPTQSNVRFVFHYFYVRAKNIWKNFPNWIQGLEQHTPPFLNKPKDFYKNGSLADYLDIPTAVHSSARKDSDPTTFTAGIPIFGPTLVGYKSVITYLDDQGSVIPVVLDSGHFTMTTGSLGENDVVRAKSNKFNFLLALGNWNNDYSSFTPSYLGDKFVAGDILGSVTFDGPRIEDFTRAFIFIRSNAYPSLFYGKIEVLIGAEREIVVTRDCEFDVPTSDVTYYLGIPDFSITVDESEPNSPKYLFPFYIEGHYNVRYRARSYQVSDSNNYCPYYNNNNTNGIKVSALPFRAVESIYNAFYRNQQGVQPFTIAGQVKYNQYVTKDTDGADSTDYHLERHNWELDAYTSCLISPQQNSTPYVGMTRVSALGEMEIETSDGNRASVKLDDLENGVEITDLHGETPEARRLALNAASLGFTIPEFREANALQRFLELNIRKGYRYVDFIAGHFGKSPKYAEMDMPEFIGGFTQRVKMNEISNTNAVGADGVDALGSLAGQARAIGASQHGISHYFDDFGFVVGMVCIIPDIAYDSILPKHYNLTHPLDMYFPEFGQLSMQPITYEEFCPIQCKVANLPLTDVFGYQRPNHDLVWYPDTVHGEFRDPSSGFGDSIIVRRFGERPNLNSEFLKINPQDTDTIFSYQMGDNDICLSEIVCKISAKRPIPRIVVPNL